MVKGFESTGIFSVNHLKYKVDRLDKVKVKNYYDWKSAGSPVSADGTSMLTVVYNDADNNDADNNDADNNEIETTAKDTGDIDMSIVTTPSSSNNLACCSKSNAPNEAFSPNSSIASSASSMQQTPSTLLKMLQKHAPVGMKYCLTMVPCEEEIPLEKILKAKRQPVKPPVAPAKRHKVSMSGAVLTNKSFVEEIKTKKDEDQNKKEKAAQRVLLRQKKRRR